MSFRFSRSERSERYGSDGRIDGPDWHDRRQGRDVEREHDHQLSDDKHRDSPEVSEQAHLCEPAWYLTSYNLASTCMDMTLWVILPQ